MDMEKLFDINSYSEKNMPLSCKLFDLLVESVFTEKSEDFKKADKRDTFDDVENALLDKMYAVYLNGIYIQQREWFNIGFHLGTAFAAEVCGK